MLVFTVAVSIFLTIMIANMGGHVDNIMRGEIRERLAVQLLTDQNYQELSTEEKGKCSRRKNILDSMTPLPSGQPFI